ncbi:MAG: hypothetical protein C0592_10480 [Marinilabiliales bacterium]|nr:MAG: hypothetical protein C0592_10480 [Marinilabiliales bacterium]
MRSFFKRDNIWLGMGVALVVPVLIFFLLILINSFSGKDHLLQKDTMQLIAIFVNLIPFRYYLVRVKADRTGRGILLITIIMALVYFYFNIEL